MSIQHTRAWWNQLTLLCNIGTRKLSTANRSRVSISGRPCKNFPHILITMQNLVVVSLSVCVEVPKFWELDCLSVVRCDGAWLTARHNASPSAVLPCKIRSFQVKLYERHSCRQIWPSRPASSRSLKVTVVDTDRSATHDFLLVSVIIMGLSRTVSEIDVENRIFPTPCI